jgi:hypothetical protein
MDEFNTSVETQEVAEPVISEQATETTTEPVNAGSGEVTTPQVDEKQVQTKEENAGYADMRRKYEARIVEESQRAIDAEYDRLYGESHGIHNKADYDQAIIKQEQLNREEEIRQEYESKGVPEELLEELVLSKREREERAIEKQNEMQQQQSRLQQERNFAEFLAEYPTVKAEEIPNEVWVEVGNGKSLVDAYAKHEVTTLRNKIAEYEGKFKAQETNTNNAQSSTGSVTGNGIADTGFISAENFEANKGNQRWVMNNLSKITESRSKW